MKVCVVTVEYPPFESGVALACRRIARRMRDKVQVHVLTFGSERDNLFANQARKLTTTVEDSITVHRISPYSGTLTSVPAQDIQAMCHFLSVLDAENSYDLFHGFNLTGAGFVAAYTARLRQKKSLVSIRGNDIGRDVFDQSKAGSLAWVINHADHLTFVAHDLLLLADTLEPCRRKSTVIHNSLDPSDFFYQDIKLRLDGFVVGFCGVVRQKKGCSYLFEAFEHFAKEHKATLLVIGELMPEEKHSYLQMIERHRLAKNVMITGMVPHKVVLNYINLADVLVFPALSEGCANALLEAMYCGKPCVSTRPGAAAEILDGKNGLLIEPYSTDEIYRALVQMKKSRQRAKMGALAKKTIVERFTPQHEEKAWLSVYRQCLES
jgi:L-malate glycosyltransferase